MLVRVLKCQKREGSLERVCAMLSRYVDVLHSGEALVTDAPTGTGSGELGVRKNAARRVK